MNKNYTAATIQLEKLLMINDSDSEAKLNLGFAYAKLGKLELALAQWQPLLDQPTTAGMAANNIGVYHVLNEDLNTGLNYFRNAIANTPNLAAAYKNMADIFMRQEKFNDAALAYERQLQFDPSDNDSHTKVGQLYLTQKRPHQAIEHLRAALALNSEDEFNYFNLAVAYQANGDKKEAIEFYQQFLSRAKSGEKWDKSVFQAEAAIAKLKKK